MILKIKICCISSIHEANLAIRAGASALGLVANMPSGPGIIPEALIAEIAKIIPPPIASFLLTSETDAEKIISQHSLCNTNTIQLVDKISPQTYLLLRKNLPSIKLVQVIHVLDELSVTEAIESSQYVHAILLDSGNPNLSTKELGGTGRTHNWKLSRRIRESIKIPLFLAGGINHENVIQAIDTVNPFGIDLCSGVRTDGQLDNKKLELLFATIQKQYQN